MAYSLPTPYLETEVEHLKATFRQMIDMLGYTITYMSRSETGEDSYGHPTYTFTSQTFKSIVTNISDREYQFVEPGLLPTHYAKLFLYQVTPKIGDRVSYVNIEWEVRGIIPMTINGQVIYYETIIRRRI
jgi:hypothetical protein